MKLRLFMPGLLALIMLSLVSIACNLVKKTEPTATETIPVSTDALDSLKEDLQDVGQQIESGGQVTLVINEEELTSLVAFELQSQEPPIFQEPQVYLRDGQIKIIGKVQQGNAMATFELILTLSASGDGRPVFQIASAKIGPLPIPEAMVKQMSDQIDMLFTSKIDPRMDELFIEKITIADGEMTIQGHKR